MSFKDDDKPPTSKEEAAARRMRPPLERYDPDKRSDWSITMTVAWIIWREIDAVRNEWDEYREKCADWLFKKTLSERLAERIADNDRTGLARSNPDFQKKLQEKLEELEKEPEPSWHPHQWESSGWGKLRLKARMENLPPQVAIDELWQAAREGRIKATAREYKNAKAYVGDPIEIPAHHWPYLKGIDDPLTGKAMLSDDNGRVYREVLFPQLDVKELWPKSPPLPEEPLVEHVEKPEPEPTGPAEPELLKPAAWFDDVRKDNPQRKNELPGAYAGRLHPLMQEAHEAKHVAKLWPLKTLLRRLYDK